MARKGRNRGRRRVGVASRGRGGIRFGSQDLAARKDTIIAGGYVNNGGAQTPGSGWNGAQLPLPAGSQVAYQAIVIPQAVTAVNAPPSIGECEVDQIEGSLYLSSPGSAGIYQLGVGIYISKFDTRTGTWAIRYPSNSSSDAARDDWLMLKAMTVALPLTAGVTDPMLLEFKLMLPHPIILGGGEALHVCVDNNTNSPATINVQAFFRTRVSNVT